ncbi:bifunctional endo-1,4-beta-xylanase XylA-like [Salvia divinorum]|uniref:Bifunctional endo-1,4-beta-xylanase XylA-like n=1 Tax=Salvia divinorum TaxID=28513 RepID=A0ABD1I3J2_SALDI
MQANNDVVHKLQDAQLEQKAAMDMMAKQLSQIATSLNEMKGNDGKIPATVKMPARENISKITLRSGKAYDEPKMRTEGEGEDGLIKQTGQAGDSYDLRKEDLLKSLPPMANPFFLDQEPRKDLKEEKRMKRKRKKYPQRARTKRFPRRNHFPTEEGQRRKERTQWTSWKSLESWRSTCLFYKPLNFPRLADS